MVRCCSGSSSARREHQCASLREMVCGTFGWMAGAGRSRGCKSPLSRLLSPSERHSHICQSTFCAVTTYGLVPYCSYSLCPTRNFDRCVCAYNTRSAWPYKRTLKGSSSRSHIVQGERLTTRKFGQSNNVYTH